MVVYPPERRRLLALPARSISLLLLLLSVIGCGGGGNAEAGEFGLAWEPGDLFAPPPAGYSGPIDLAVDGSHVYVLDAMSDQVHQHAHDGRYLTSFGRRGQGPGELAQPTAIGVFGERIWVLNGALGRVEWFLPGGTHVGTSPIDGPERLFHARVHQGRWVASAIFGPAAIVSYPFEGDSYPFEGDSLLNRSAVVPRDRLRARAPGIPPAYRVAVVGGRVWGLHVEAPSLIRLGEDGTVTEVDFGERPFLGGRSRGSEDQPVGGMEAVEGVDGKVYVFTKEEDSRGRQILRVFSAEGDALGKVASPLDGWVGAAVAHGDRVFTIGMIDDVPVVRSFVLGAGTRPEGRTALVHPDGEER